MSVASDSLLQPSVPLAMGSAIVPASAERWMTELHTLLQELEAVTEANRTLPPVFGPDIDDRLVQVRLGMASSLFTALQCKNAALAGHALRVALSCSAWARQMELPEDECNTIEIASLLHDVGMIGAPDSILLKPQPLDDSEAEVIANARKMSLDILRRSCTSPKILEIVENVPAWYDGRRPGFRVLGPRIPMGARMIAIAEAFDAMTTDHVFRPARSYERAMAELFECAGTQFDPELVERFAEFRQTDPGAGQWDAAHRWLRLFDPAAVHSCWDLNCEVLPTTEPAVETMFQDRLLDNMYDAVVFVDASGRVVLWNRGAERLTGIRAAGIRGYLWQPAMLGLADEQGRAIGESDCPVHTAIRCGAQSLRRLTILGRAQQTLAVDTHAIPVVDKHGVTQGAVLLFHDASSEISLEQRCQSLHDKATRDPMTQVANRAEFDRVHETFVAAHQQQRVPCSLLMCDLDRFKQVNDTYGHQAGDDAIKSLAALLRSSCRPGDLVARYGGEEFVVLCADCDNASAARRADQIRQNLSEMAQPKLHGRAVTVSFGVTEIQPGDTPETMLRRADRALLMAKANGRNTVVQLGTGIGEAPGSEPWVDTSRPQGLFEQDLLTPVPVKMAVEKLRGFVADHEARIVGVEENRVRLEIDARSASRLRRLTDRPVTLELDVRFEEENVRKDVGKSVFANHGTTRTRIKVAISPAKGRDRRREEVMAHAREILMSFRSYLMATEDEASPSSPMTRLKRILTPWRE